MFEIEAQKKKKIKDMLDEIQKECVVNKIPFFFALAENDNGQETDYYTSILSPKIANQPLSDDKITKMMLVMDGFLLQPPTHVTEFNFD